MGDKVIPVKVAVRIKEANVLEQVQGEPQVNFLLVFVLLYKLMKSGTYGTSMVSIIFSYYLWYLTVIHDLNHFYVGLYSKY